MKAISAELIMAVGAFITVLLSVWNSIQGRRKTVAEADGQELSLVEAAVAFHKDVVREKLEFGEMQRVSALAENSELKVKNESLQAHILALEETIAECMRLFAEFLNNYDAYDSAQRASWRKKVRELLARGYLV